MEQPQINQTTTDGGSGTNTILIVLVIIIILVGGYFLFMRNGDTMPAENNDGGVNINVDLPAGNNDGGSGAGATGGAPAGGAAN